MLQKYREGKATVSNYKRTFDEYNDRLSTTIKFLDEKRSELNEKVVKPAQIAKEKMRKLNAQLDNTEAVQEFIKERKKQLIQYAMQHLGKTKYLQKINKESYYYVQTLVNYKELFDKPGKAEELAMQLLRKLNAFNKFMQENSTLSSLFGSPAGTANPNGTVGLLQSRAMVNATVQSRIRAAGANPQQLIQQAFQQAQAEVNKLKQKALQWNNNGKDFELPNFKPNTQKTKTLKQRLEFMAGIQTVRHNRYFPANADMSFSAGYKPSDKMIIGLGVSYKVGLGNSISQIKISHQGVGLRSFIDWKIKGGFYLSGGYEQNYFSEIRRIQQLQDLSGWKGSALAGLSKKYNMGKKRKGEMKILYDFFSQTKSPRTSPILFRIGIGL
ncbi:MAG: hypothetical protein JNM88_14095 [Chitinophagaceae bacterium]|nr:hypothetical protein [Chitinophagaceae bacterium]